MDNKKELQVIFTGNTLSLEKAFATAQAGAANTAKSLDTMGSTLSRTGSQLSSLGHSLTTAITVPLVGIGVAATKMAVDFQQQMTYVRTDAGDTTDNIDQMSQSVLNLAKSSQFGPDELAKGLYHIASLGLRGAEAMNALNIAQEMASVGGANLEETTTALGGAIVSGIKGVQDYTSAAGTMDAIVGAGNMRMNDLVSAVGTGILPVFKNAGLSLTDFGAALATLTDNGMRADEAATRLKMSVSLMEAPSHKAAKAMEAIGLQSTQLGLDMQTKGLIPALQELQKHLLDTYGTTDMGKEKMAEAISAMFGGGRSSAAIQTLLGQLDRVQSKFDQIGSQSGDFAGKVAEQQQTSAAKIKTAWSGVQADMIKLGGDLLPGVAKAFTDIVGKIDELTKWWGTLDGQQKHFIETSAEVIAVLGPGLSLFGKLASTFGTLAKLGGGAATAVKGILGAFGGAEAGAAGIAGVGVEAGAATTALGGFAAVLTGPVGIALGATALAAGGAYLAYKHFHDMGKENNDLLYQSSLQYSSFNRTANDLGVSITNTGSKVDMLTLAQIHQNDAQRIVDAATQQHKVTVDRYNTSVQDSVKATDDVFHAQEAVTDAFNKYGQNSPQWAAATQNLNDKQDALNRALFTQTGLNLTVKSQEGDLYTANYNLAGAIQASGDMEKYLNDQLAAGVGVISKFGPTALDQVPSIAVLQQSIGTVVTAFSGMSANIQDQSPKLNGMLQGINGQAQQVVQTFQGASNNIQLFGNYNPSGANGASPQRGGSFNPQHNAGGTNYFSGGLTWVGEQGPELINLARGSTVTPSPQSMQAAAGGGGGDVHINVTAGVVAGSNGMQELANTIYQTLQRNARAQGMGSVLPNIGSAVPTG